MRLFLSPPLHQLRRVWSSRSPLLLFAIKNALAAGLSWEIVSTLFGREAASFAVVSAVIVVQVTSWQTVSKSIQRILGVIISVSLAVVVAHLLGLNFWTITIMIFFAQVLGLFLQNRGQYLAEPFLAGQFRMEYPFLELPNVLGSPHNSGVVPGILMGATRQAAENVKRFLNGEQVVGIARREDYL